VPHAAGPNPQQLTEAAVEGYMLKNAAPQCEFTFLDWTDYSATGPAAAITLHYRVEQPTSNPIEATVRFSLQDGNVTSATTVAEQGPPGEDAAKAAVEDYIRKHAAPECTISYMDWTDYSISGDTSVITLRYRVEQPPQADVVVSVRFTIQAGTVVNAELAGQPVTGSAPVIRRRAPTPPPVVVDRFSQDLYNSINGSPMTLHLGDAYSLAQLEDAKARARSEKKPLGFVMVWGQFFDHEADPRGGGSDSALVHFYEAFNNQIILVFVRHESELNDVPQAVKRGFFGADEGGYAPNMAVTDASASEFIVEIPFRDALAVQRDQIFAQGAWKIDQWLATHPDAMASPAPVSGSEGP
jgi:hypothetical protein